MQKFLVIQTAFIGDVVLATGIIEKLHQYYPAAQIDFLVRKGNEGLLKSHPFLHEVLVWDKQQNKLQNLWRLIRRIRKTPYDKVINVQRFAATGLLTIMSGANTTIGFDKNPFSRFFTQSVPHIISDGTTARHEIERNHALVQSFTDETAMKPRLYPAAEDEEKVNPYKTGKYITVSPASVWFTKQYPADKWISFLQLIPNSITVYLLGAPGDKNLADKIAAESKHPAVINLCGELTFLESAALMKDALMNYVNDSAPLHFASAVNAPVSAIYCSTIPAFGFGPVSDNAFVIEVEEKLTCRPCGLHGKKACPLGHFHCAYHIREEQLLRSLPITEEY